MVVVVMAVVVVKEGCGGGGQGGLCINQWNSDESGDCDDETQGNDTKGSGSDNEACDGGDGEKAKMSNGENGNGRQQW